MPDTQGLHGSSRGNGGMIPPRGFKNELYPLRHRVIYSFGLSIKQATMNTAFCTLVRHTNDIIAGTPASIVVNPHNSNYVEDAGAAVTKMSIIDKLRLSIRFNMTLNCNPRHETAAGVFGGDDVPHLKLLWRPIFFSFPEKLQATDDETGASVATILALTSTDAQEDVVPITTNKLPVIGNSTLSQPLSTVNIVEVGADDYNMTTNATMEDQVWDEDVFQKMLRRGTNKGALKACVGRTRHVNLTRSSPFKNFYIDKFVPRAIRRVVDRTFFGIQVHMPLESDIGQDYLATTPSGSLAHIGCKIIANYHEWNADHFQDMAGTAP